MSRRPLTIDSLYHSIVVYGDEFEFSYRGEHFFISACIAPEGQIFIGGPKNDEYVSSFDEVLDKLIVAGKPLRHQLPLML